MILAHQLGKNDLISLMLTAKNWTGILERGRNAEPGRTKE